MPKAGDTFAFRLTSTEWLSGRVLLDVKGQCIKPRKVAPDSRLGFFNAAFLVEIYATPTPGPAVASDRVLIPSMFVNAGGFKGAWEMLGNVAVDPTAVDFPPVIAGRGVETNLSWGELYLPTKLTNADADEIDVMATVHSAGIVAPTCLFTLGRGDELDPVEYTKPSALSLASTDLRFSPHEARVFESAGLPKRGSYYEESLARGFDLRRFYA